MTDEVQFFAIGFHGLPREDETPARSQPILATEDGRIAFERADGRFEADAARIPEGPLSGRATRVEPRIPARPGWLILILGRSDVEALRDDFPELSVVGEQGDSVGRRVGDALVVYAEPGLAAQVWAELRESIRDLMMKAGRRGLEGELERQAWRLQRVAIEQRDHLDALAALRRAESPLWRDAASAMFPTRTDIERVVEQRCSELFVERFGRLSRARSSLRSAFYPDVKKAAA